MGARVIGRWTIALLVLVGLLTGTVTAAPLMRLAADVATAPVVEVKTGLEAGKFCSVIRSCNFSRNAAVRGCLSSYSCRQCDFVKRCSGGRCEWRSRCGWGSAGS